MHAGVGFVSNSSSICLRKRKKTAGDDDGDQNPSAGGGPANKKRSAKLLVQRAQMKELLAQPLVARGISMKYLTSGSKSVVDDLLTSSSAYPYLLGQTHLISLNSLES